MKQLAMNNLYLEVGVLSDPIGITNKRHELEQCKNAAEKLGFTWMQIRAKNRKRELIDVKTCICKFLYEKNWTLNQISNELNMHYSTIIHHKNKFDKLITRDREIQIIWQTLKQ
mgnify:CR=1 FL=1